MWWLLLLIPFALIMLVLFVKVRLCLIYEDDLDVKVKVLFFNIPLYPQKQKKIKPSDYSLNKLQKKQAKLDKKSKKQPKKQTASQPKGKDTATKIKDSIGLIRIILDNVMSPFGRYLKIEIIKIYVKIASEDAAKTAFIYGLASQGIAYIIELLSNVTNVDVKKKNSIRIIPDFLDTTSEARINITLGLRGWHAFVLAVKFFMGYIKSKNNTNDNINSLKTQEEK
jgi:hypothetical protein